jgi:hypothetical protein
MFAPWCSRLLIAGALLFAPSGCLLAMPHVRADVGGGVYTRGGAPQSEGSFRAAMFPTQLFRDAADRVIDVGAGYGYDNGGSAGSPGALALHTAYMELDLRRPFPTITRDAVVSVGIAPRYVWDTVRDTSGGGASLRLSLDLVRGFAEGWFTGDAAAGAAYGEASLGFYTEGVYVAAGPARLMTVTGGMSFRLPAWGVVGY